MRFAVSLAVFARCVLAQSPAGIPGVVAPGVQPELVQEGFVLTEGPVGTPDGGLFFSDVGANTIYRMDPTGKITMVRLHTEGANGLALNSGELYAAESAGKRISRGNQNGRNTTVVDTATNGQPLGAPNDLIFDAKGRFYFTDPGDKPRLPTDIGAYGKVYYVSATSGEPPIAIDDQIAFPNGLTITLDGKKLLVDDTLGDTIWAFDLVGNSGLKKSAFAKIPQLTDGKSLADGMAIDRDGRVYVATHVGIQVFDKKGKFQGIIKTPRPPSSIAFSGPDKRTLYITAREGLYKLQTLSQGPERQGK